MKTKYQLGQKVWALKVDGLFVNPFEDTITLINAQDIEHPIYGLSSVIAEFMAAEKNLALDFPLSLFPETTIYASRSSAIEAAIERTKELCNERIHALADSLVSPVKIETREKRTYSFDELVEQASKGGTIKTHPVYACRKGLLYVYFGKDLKSAKEYFQRPDVDEIISHKSTSDELDPRKWWSESIKDLIVPTAEQKE